MDLRLGRWGFCLREEQCLGAELGEKKELVSVRRQAVIKFPKPVADCLWRWRDVAKARRVKSYFYDNDSRRWHRDPTRPNAIQRDPTCFVIGHVAYFRTAIGTNAVTYQLYANDEHRTAHIHGRQHIHHPCLPSTILACNPIIRKD